MEVITYAAAADNATPSIQVRRVKSILAMVKNPFAPS